MISSRRGWFCGVDCARTAASAIALSEDHARLLGARPGQATVAHQASVDGLPFRLELGDPTPIERDTDTFPVERWWEEPAAAERNEPPAIEVSSIEYLVDQVCPRVPDRVGVIVQDALRAEYAESLLRALGSMRTPRGRISLFPWPVAAAWSWISRFASTLDRPQGEPRAIVGSILAVYLSDRAWQAVPVHLIHDSTCASVVPGRDRDGDKLVMGGWSRSTRGPEPEGLVEACETFGIRFAGLSISGRPAESTERQARIFDLLATRSNFVGARLETDESHRTGLLARGAALAARAVADRLVPYFESVPKLELLGSTSGRSLEPPHGRISVQYWLDVLKGLPGIAQFGGRRLVPAATKLRHRPAFEDPLSVYTNRPADFQLAFDGRDVRRVSAHIPPGRESTERVDLEVELEFGSGRPRVSVIRRSDPKEPIVLAWDKAEATPLTRDETTELDGACAMEQIRLADEAYVRFKRRRAGLE
jgi:hypothetical protein